MDKKEHKYIGGLQKVFDVHIDDGYVVCTQGCKVLKYKYKDINDLKDFCINHYYETVRDGKRTITDVCGRLMGISQQAAYKKIFVIEKTIKDNFTSMGYNV